MLYADRVEANDLLRLSDDGLEDGGTDPAGNEAKRALVAKPCDRPEGVGSSWSTDGVSGNDVRDPKRQ
jgi:hypothetical protein